VSFQDVSSKMKVNKVYFDNAITVQFIKINLEI